MVDDELRTSRAAFCRSPIPTEASMLPGVNESSSLTGYRRGTVAGVVIAARMNEVPTRSPADLPVTRIHWSDCGTSVNVGMLGAGGSGYTGFLRVTRTEYRRLLVSDKCRRAQCRAMMKLQWQTCTFEYSYTGARRPTKGCSEQRSLEPVMMRRGRQLMDVPPRPSLDHLGQGRDLRDRPVDKSVFPPDLAFSATPNITDHDLCS
ncbi:hypothetical protein C8Q78DRAFT_43383 [Trametes maxima]|nr:hypothetical protein C8Q78DRAFT_43383 [Trametes maxima]